MAQSEFPRVPAKAGTAERSRTRAIGRLEKHVHELAAAVDTWGAGSGMTESECSAVKEITGALVDALWERAKSAAEPTAVVDDAENPLDEGHP